MKYRHFAVVALAAAAALQLSSCSDKSAQLAAQRLAVAQQAFADGQYVLARQEIDSIRTLYPAVVDVRRQALELQQRIELEEQTRSIEFEDSILIVARGRLEAMLPDFKLEHDTAYQDMGNWTIASQAPENNLSRSYLRAQVAQDGRLMLISSYRGTKYIHHRSIRVSMGQLYCQSPESDDCYEYTDLDLCYEKCNLHHGNDGGVAAFIAQNRDASNMTLMLNGSGKTGTKVTLTKSDIKAIAKLYDLSQLLLFIGEHQAQRDESARRVQFVTERLSVEEP